MKREADFTGLPLALIAVAVALPEQQQEQGTALKVPAPAIGLPDRLNVWEDRMARGKIEGMAVHREYIIGYPVYELSIISAVQKKGHKRGIVIRICAG